MSSTLSFLPRKVAASSRKQNAQAKPIDPDGVEERPDSRKEQINASGRDTSNAIQSEGKGKGKARAAEQRTLKLTNDDYARLVCLALSDYALWSDPELRRALDPAQGVDESTTLYVSLSDVLKRLPRSFGVLSPQTAALAGIVKALRICAAELIGVRLLLEQPSLASDGWQRTGGSVASSKSLGGYELCRKDWTRENTPARFSYSRQDWHERTIYVERIPTQYRSVPGVLRLIENLLPGSDASLHPMTRIQGVTLPAHHQDKPGDTPTFKDFCLVTVVSTADVEFLIKRWRWDRNASRGTDISDESDEGETKGDVEIIKEATKFGFRVLRKADWEQLREEYLSYRARLIQEINKYEDAQAETQTIALKRPREVATDAYTPSSNATSRSQPRPTLLPPNAPFPYGCLVFVRNIHPETNKTTLRALFSSIFQNEADGTLKNDGLDYVDFNKGVDSCYLRLSTSSHADTLVLHFTEQRLTQTSGLDDKGTPTDPSSTAKPIMLEKVSGKREEVYWERVPEKVRKQAVQKSIELARERFGEVEPDSWEAPKKKRRKA